MAYVVKTQKGYIKRTSHFGAFHGSIVLTDDVNEAFRFTRKSDAEARGGVAAWRTREPDDRGQWDSRGGYPHDIKKFGGALTYTVEES
jgi:hypothetical protein